MRREGGREGRILASSCPWGHTPRPRPIRVLGRLACGGRGSVPDMGGRARACTAPGRLSLFMGTRGLKPLPPTPHPQEVHCAPPTAAVAEALLGACTAQGSLRQAPQIPDIKAPGQGPPSHIFTPWSCPTQPRDKSPVSSLLSLMTTAGSTRIRGKYDVFTSNEGGSPHGTQESGRSPGQLGMGTGAESGLSDTRNSRRGG